MPRGVKKFFDGVILFKEYFDVLVEYLCGVKTERGVWRGGVQYHSRWAWCVEEITLLCRLQRLMLTKTA